MDSRPKDSVRMVLESGEFLANFAKAEHVEATNRTGASLGDLSEFD